MICFASSSPNLAIVNQFENWVQSFFWKEGTLPRDSPPLLDLCPLAPPEVNLDILIRQQLLLELFWSRFLFWRQHCNVKNYLTLFSASLISPPSFTTPIFPVLVFLLYCPKVWTKCAKRFHYNCILSRNLSGSKSKLTEFTDWVCFQLKENLIFTQWVS